MKLAETYTKEYFKQFDKCVDHAKSIVLNADKSKGYVRIGFFNLKLLSLVSEWAESEGFKAVISHWFNYPNCKQVTYLDISWDSIEE